MRRKLKLVSVSVLPILWALRLCAGITRTCENRRNEYDGCVKWRILADELGKCVTVFAISKTLAPKYA